MALLWRKGLFDAVSVVQCRSIRIAAIISALVSGVLRIPYTDSRTGAVDHITVFSDCMGEISAIVEECSMDSVYVLGDFKADPRTRFGSELGLFCEDQKWKCADIEVYRYIVRYTFVSDVSILVVGWTMQLYRR